MKKPTRAVIKKLEALIGKLEALQTQINHYGLQAAKNELLLVLRQVE